MKKCKKNRNVSSFNGKGSFRIRPRPTEKRQSDENEEREKTLEAKGRDEGLMFGNCLYLVVMCYQGTEVGAGGLSGGGGGEGVDPTSKRLREKEGLRMSQLFEREKPAVKEGRARMSE